MMLQTWMIVVAASENEDGEDLDIVEDTPNPNTAKPAAAATSYVCRQIAAIAASVSHR